MIQVYNFDQLALEFPGVEDYRHVASDQIGVQDTLNFLEQEASKKGLLFVQIFHNKVEMLYIFKENDHG